MTVQQCFNTQPPEGGCIAKVRMDFDSKLFQHTAARRRLRELNIWRTMLDLFQHTAARRRLQPVAATLFCCITVSTHSRPKAAAIRYIVSYSL